jgi:hypothetical protein
MTQPWRTHPKLRGRFHPDAPDDVQVLVHDGGPRLTDRSPEAVWVTVTDCNDDDIFTGRVLNHPQQLTSVRQGDEIKFIAPAGEHLLMVTDKYLQERPNWDVQPCSQCGLDELFDAPSDLMRVVFPDIPEGATMEVFTSFCGVCGGVQVVQDKNVKFEDEPTAQQDSKKWWQFWK